LWPRIEWRGTHPTMRAALVPIILLAAVSMGCSGRASGPPAQVPGTTTLTNASVLPPPREKLILPEVNFDDEDEDEGTDGPNDLGGSLPKATYALRDTTK
jgi:hypothetical protein